MASQKIIERSSDELDQEEERHKAENADRQSARLQTGSLEADPLFFYESRNRERNEQSNVSIAVVHHFLRVNQQTAVNILHRIRLEGYVGDAEPAENKHRQKEDVLFFRMLFNV